MNRCATALMLLTCALCGCSKILFSEHTDYAKGFSESKFLGVTNGMSVLQVEALLGSPLSVATQKWEETWFYYPPASASSQTTVRSGNRVYSFPDKDTRFIFNQSSSVVEVLGDYLRGDFIGLTKEQIEAKFGQPAQRELRQFELIYRYTKPGESGTYKKREVHFDASSKVVSTVAEIYYD